MTSSTKMFHSCKKSWIYISETRNDFFFRHLFLFDTFQGLKNNPLVLGNTEFCYCFFLCFWQWYEKIIFSFIALNHLLRAINPISSGNIILKEKNNKKHESGENKKIPSLFLFKSLKDPEVFIFSKKFKFLLKKTFSACCHILEIVTMYFKSFLIN